MVGREAPEACDWALTVFLAATFLLGGGSRYDIVSLIVLRPVSAAMLAYAIFCSTTNLSSFKTPIALLGAWMGLAVLQLVPLPPGIWTALPGREPIVASFAATGTAPGWEPLSVVPMATLNALLALILPLAVLLLFAESSSAERRRALRAIAAFAFVSALLGILQVVEGGQGPLYPYSISNEGLPIGLFANRNHQAAVLAAAIPLTLAIAADHEFARRGLSRWIGRAIALGLVVVVVMTGSRAGSVLALGALFAGSLLLSPAERRTRSERHASNPRLTPVRAIASRWTLPAILLAVIALVFVVASGTAFERLAAKDGLGDLRFQILPTVGEMIRASFPFGFGFGTFPWTYDMFEPVRLMRADYINRAHDDWLELFIDGGVFAPALALAGVAWLVARCRSLRRFLFDPESDDDRHRLAALLGILILVLASLFDYPLRTPSVAAILMVFVGCLAAPRRT
jgi:hypothetical protein